MQKVYILAFLLICICAKKHEVDTKACVQKNCSNQLKACDQACFEQIRTCAPKPGFTPSQEQENKVVACLKKNPQSSAFIGCMVKFNCAPQQRHLPEDIMEHLMTYAELLA